MASMTISASIAARASAAATPNSSSRHLASSSSVSLRGSKCVAAAPVRLSNASAAGRRALKVTNIGLN